MKYGPEDISDFSIELNYLHFIAKVQPVPITIDQIQTPVVDLAITTKDLHPVLRPYRPIIYFQALGDLNDTYTTFNPPETKAGGGSIVSIYTNLTKPGYYPIIIQGTGSDRKKHNITIFMYVVSPEDYQKNMNHTLKWPLTPIQNEVIASSGI